MAVDPDAIAQARRLTRCAHALYHALTLLSSQAFVQHYYTTFDAPTTRASLASLYQPQSMLTFEGSKLMARPRLPHSSHRLSRAACSAFACSSAPARRGRCVLRRARVIRPRGPYRCAGGCVKAEP